MAAAMPPSAMTVWALPSSDLQTRAVRAPRSCASMAARRPAPPAPMTTTSKSWVSCSAMLEHPPRVADDASGHQPDVDVGEGHEDQADPGQEHVAGVQGRHLAPHPVAGRGLGEAVEPAPAQVPAGVAGHGVEAK